MSATSDAIQAAPASRRAKDTAWVALMACSGLSILLLGVRLYDVVKDGAGHLDADFISNFTSISADKAGAQAVIWGTIWLMGICALFIVPVGVATAIYPEEYADNERCVQPADRGQHPEPRRGAVGRLRDPRAGVPGARPALAREHRARRRPHARAAGAARGDHRRPGGDP